MGEHKLRSKDEIERLAKGITELATDDGQIIALGALAFIKYVVPADAQPEQIRDMRNAFIAGADFLFTSIMNILEPGAEPTEKDLDRMNRINDELLRFRKEMTMLHMAPERKQ
jgi:hypothetical protein